MTIPISSNLANMEYMLYGGNSLAQMSSVPNALNGYMAQSSYINPYMYNMGNNSIFNQQKQQFKEQSESVQNSATSGKSDLEILKEYQLKGMNPSESLTSAAVGGAAFALLPNSRFIVHPWNSLSTIHKVESMFKDVKKEGTALYELWKNPETHKVMADAYAKAHKLEGAAKSRLPIFKSRLDESVVSSLRTELENALASGDKEAIATATEKIRVAIDAKTGYIPKAWRSVKSFLGFESKAPDIAAKIADSEAISKGVGKTLAEKGVEKGFVDQLKHGIKGQGGLGGALMMGMEFFMDWDKIKAAFNKDNSTGTTQILQTTVKGAGSLVGWAVGEAAGAWAGAKIGAMAGTAISPGLGTAIGAIAGLVGGSIGCALMGKVSHAIVGEDVGAKALVEQQKPEELLTNCLTQAQGDDNLDNNVKNVLLKYTQAA